MKTIWRTPPPERGEGFSELVETDMALAVDEAKGRRDNFGLVERTFNDSQAFDNNTGWHVSCRFAGGSPVYRFTLYDKFGEPEVCTTANDLAVRAAAAVARRMGHS